MANKSAYYREGWGWTYVPNVKKCNRNIYVMCIPFWRKKLKINANVIWGKHQVEVLYFLYTLNAWRYIFFLIFLYILNMENI